MEREHPEYTRDTYPSSGKVYNNEPAVISLTSWKARINTVAKTIFSLLKQCPGFHIVLVLSEEEFPQKEAELPDDVIAFVYLEKIELLWVYKNYKSFKKVLFTMNKYRNVPVISADDDCIYTCNYAQKLYDKWSENKKYVITNNGNKKENFYWSQGPNTLFPPSCINFGITLLNDNIIYFNNDDAFYGILFEKRKISMIELKQKNWFIFHDEIKPSSEERKKHKGFWNIFCYYKSILN